MVGLQGGHRSIFDREKVVFSMTLKEALLVVNSTGFESERFACFIGCLGRQADFSELFVEEENGGLRWQRYYVLIAVAIRRLGLTPPDPFSDGVLLPRLLYAILAVVNALQDGGYMQKDPNNGEHTLPSDTDIAAPLLAAGDGDEPSDRELARLRLEVDVAGGFVLVSKKQLALYAWRYNAYGGGVYDPDGTHGFALAGARADLDRYMRAQSPGSGGGSSTATPAAAAAAPSPLPPLGRNDNNNNKNNVEKGSKTLFATTDAGRRREERESPDGPTAPASGNHTCVEPSGGEGTAAGIGADGSSYGSTSSRPGPRPEPPRPYRMRKVSDVSEQVGIDEDGALAYLNNGDVVRSPPLERATSTAPTTTTGTRTFSASASSVPQVEAEAMVMRRVMWSQLLLG
ncbi:hypothetical protein DL766_007083 [Monosporascus sp. MC13-8B]|nr:hypothetical protein DL763_005504 [Monosporascus cannonballus]RYP25364.1 hypothetical protein DL766_007083 [Monosporascus sp. MC13-8B]